MLFNMRITTTHLYRLIAAFWFTVAALGVAFPVPGAELGAQPDAAAAGDPPDAAAVAPGRALAPVIEALVRQGLQSSLALASATLEVERSEAVLAAARARFYPELALAARYTRASGGREFTIPVAQLLNHAYQTLNELLIANGGNARFPALSDQSFPLQLPREQDTRLTLRQPLYAPAVPAAAEAARAASSSASFAREAFARELRRDLTVGYLDWLRARNALRIVATSAELLAENLRVNQSLYANGKSTHDAVLRAEAEWLAIVQQRGEVANALDQAQSYVNFLLNRPLAAALEPAQLPDSSSDAGEPGGPFEALAQSARPSLNEAAAAARRPELRQLEAAEQAASAQLRAAQAARKPTLALGVDAGTEGVDYGLGNKYNFLSASLMLNWTLFDAGARTAQVSQARVAQAQVGNQRQQAAARLELEVRTADQNLRTAQASLATARARARAARATWTTAAQRRNAGLASQLEFLDARSTLTSALLNANQAECALLQRQAEDDFARGEQP
jgi:outer membrane protein TolC